MKKPAYVYRAKVLKIVDGDTVDLVIDVGFRMTMTGRFRLHGINAPELRDHDESERIKAVLAKEALERLLMELDVTPADREPDEFPLVVETYKDPDSFGRWLARITIPGGVDVNERLLEGGFAVPFRK